MKFCIKTSLLQSKDIVVSGFNKSLFDAVSPPFPPVKVIRYDGSQTGNIVELELNFFVFKQRWVSQIRDHGETKQTTWFIDEGTTLPFFLTYWRHTHKIHKTQTGSVIEDHVEFKSYPILDILLFPLLYLQFLYRIPRYRAFFNRQTNLTETD